MPLGEATYLRLKEEQQEEVEKIAEKQDIPKSEAIRRLIDHGLVKTGKKEEVI